VTTYIYIDMQREPVVLHPDTDGIRKFVARFPEGGTVHFGQYGASDYTAHKDRERMLRYLTRHRSRENWTRSGAKTAGFWSRWLLWSEPSFEQALVRTEKVLGRPILFCPRFHSRP
jgi:hypothetical protein